MRTNKRGNIIYDNVEADQKLGRQYGARYGYDQLLLPAGWKQYDTWQDAYYFGFWVNQELRATFTYCEGDRFYVECPTEESYHAELANAAEFYGPPPPAFTCIGKDSSVTHVYDVRPT